MNTNIYPIKPTFITKFIKYGKDDPDGLSDFDLNGHGVFGQDQLYGFLAVVSHEKLVQSPISLFEFIPKSLETEINFIKKVKKNKIRILKVNNSQLSEILGSRIIVRTDNYDHFELKRSCKFFKKTIKSDEDKDGMKYCDELDSRVGFLSIENLTEDNFEIELEAHINIFNRDKEIDKIVIVPKVDTNKRPFIYYRCPISGFYEIIFPIFHERRIVGCIMIGQVIEGKMNANEVLEKFSLQLIRVGIPLSQENRKDLQQAINSDFCVEYLKAKDYHGIENIVGNNIRLISSIHENIVNLERRLRKNVILYQQRYISEKFLNIKKDFQDKALGELFSKGKLDVSELAKIIENSLIKIIEYFPNENGFIRIFMADTNGEEKKLKIMAASDRNSENYFEDFTYDLSFISDNLIKKGKAISNYDINTGFSDDSLKGIEKGIFFKNNPASNYIKDTDIVRYYPTLAPKVCFVIWKRYSQEFQQDQNQFELFKNAMFDFYTVIAANYSALWGSQMERNLENTIRIASHEANQIIPIIIDSVNTNLKDEYQLQKNIRQGTLKLRIDDIFNQLELLKLGQTTHSFAFKDIDFNKYQKMDIDIRDLINRFRNNFYKTQIQRKNLYFKLDPEKDERLFIQGNYVLIEHALNNLIDNAVKYAYRGTNLIVKLEKIKEDFIIHIFNCGSQIPATPNIFDLYSRGKGNEHIEGNGIGLYLCRKIIEAHGWKIQFKSDELYPYDIACMASYVSNKNIYSSMDKNFEILSHSFINSFAEKFISKDNSNIRYIPGSLTFKEEFNRKTFLNDFYITIHKGSFK
jgi:signal transduction histidine kinase